MNEKMTAFYEAVSTDGALQAELVAVIEGVDLEGVEEVEARQAMADAVAAFAAAHDIELTAEDILAAEIQVEGELSEEELANVAGGYCFCALIGAAKGCGCFLYGGSKSWVDDDGYKHQPRCAVVGGDIGGSKCDGPIGDVK